MNFKASKTVVGIAGLLLAGVLSLASTAQAAQQGLSLAIKAPEGSDVDRNIPKGRQAGRYDVAVIVGNRKYPRQGVPDVEYAHQDLEAMKKYLVRTMGFAAENIIEERDATKGTFETLFGSARSANGKLARWVRKDKSRVFVYYVGHGAPDPEKGDGYFVPTDADPDYIANSGYSVSTFYANLRKLQARELVVVLDTCFSGRTEKGLLFKNVSPALLRVKVVAANVGGGAVLTSSRGDQLSTWYPKQRHSLYTYYFLKGLQGAADANKDKKITTGEMQAFVGEEVDYWAGRLAGKSQQPKLEGQKDVVLATLQ